MLLLRLPSSSLLLLSKSPLLTLLPLRLPSKSPLLMLLLRLPSSLLLLLSKSPLLLRSKSPLLLGDPGRATSAWARWSPVPMPLQGRASVVAAR